MSLYRKIHLEIHADEKFRSLSKPQPNAQTLWFFLLTGPHTTAIPGLSTVGELAMAEMLEWPIKEFRRVFAEIESKGMVKADWKNRVVWIPKGIYYNQPESPNVIKSWGKQWGFIPECQLKREARQAIIKLIIDEKFGASFKKAFKEAFKEELPEDSAKVDRETGQSTFVEPSGNQEQKQEQEQQQQQDKITPLPPKSGDALFEPALGTPAHEMEGWELSGLGEELGTPEIRDLLTQHATSIRESGKKLSPTTWRAKVAKLAGMGRERAIAALRHTVENGYTGIFEPDNGKKNYETKRGNSNGSTHDSNEYRMPERRYGAQNAS